MAYIIAEAVVNHNGNLSTAKDMIYMAKEAGCDCIKFQTFQPDMLVTRKAARAEYQIANIESTDSRYDMLKLLTLSASDYAELKMCCEQIGSLYQPVILSTGMSDIKEV